MIRRSSNSGFIPVDRAGLGTPIGLWNPTGFSLLNHALSCSTSDYVTLHELVQANDWDAQKAELVPLTTEHAELVALYEADRAKLAELEEDAQDVVDDAKALEAELERRALELAKVRAEAHHRVLCRREQRSPCKGGKSEWLAE